MRKFIALFLITALLFCCSCSRKVYKTTETFFMMDTVVTISADCDSQIIKEAFDLCTYYENMLSRTKEGSDIYNINQSGSAQVSEETLRLIEKAIYYGDLSQGRFDVTVCPVSSLYDFNNKTMPDEEKIKQELPKIDYKKIKVEATGVTIENSQLDLGGIAKGYITDKVVELLKSRGVSRASINLGGNVYCYGEKEIKIGVRKPFSEEILATIVSGEGTFVTSGIYQRYIEKDDKIYHHIIDPKTGLGVENDLSAVTVIGKNSVDADALSTVCMLMGSKDGISLMETIEDYQAVFVLRDGTVKLTSGLTMKNNIITVN